jgi:hypothetical protein
MRRIKSKLTVADRSGALVLLAHNPKVGVQVPPRFESAAVYAALMRSLRKSSSVVSHLRAFGASAAKSTADHQSMRTHSEEERAVALAKAGLRSQSFLGGFVAKPFDCTQNCNHPDAFSRSRTVHAYRTSSGIISPVCPSAEGSSK